MKSPVRNRSKFKRLFEIIVCKVPTVHIQVGQGGEETDLSAALLLFEGRPGWQCLTETCLWKQEKKQEHYCRCYIGRRSDRFKPNIPLSFFFFFLNLVVVHWDILKSNYFLDLSDPLQVRLMSGSIELVLPGCDTLNTEDTRAARRTKHASAQSVRVSLRLI